MNLLTVLGEAVSVPALDISGLTNILTIANFQSVITSVLGIVGLAVITGFIFYVVRWAIGLFRGI